MRGLFYSDTLDMLKWEDSILCWNQGALNVVYYTTAMFVGKSYFIHILLDPEEARRHRYVSYMSFSVLERCSVRRLGRSKPSEYFHNLDPLGVSKLWY
jgi:hypothetical protein